MLSNNNSIRPVSITRFPSFRTQTRESLSVDSVKKSLERPIKIGLRASQTLGHSNNNNANNDNTNNDNNCHIYIYIYIKQRP